MNDMNFLGKLLDGVAVEWKTLGSLGELVRGNGLQKKDFTETGIPAIHYGQIYTYYGLSTTSTKSFVSPELAKQLRKVDNGDVVITNTSENLEDVGKALVYLGECQAVTGGHATILKPGECLLGKYFAYFTQTDKFAGEKRKYAKGAKVIDISAKDMGKILIPIPCPENPKKSLEIQAKIVRILDTFTELTNELTNELTARKKQYNHYRDQLLTFEEGVPFLPLSLCCESIADGDHQAPQKTENGIPFITISDVSATNQIDFSKTKFVSHSYYDGLNRKRKAQANDILYTVVGSFGIPVHIDNDRKFTFQRHIAILRPNPKIAMSKYIYHALRGSSVVKQAHSVATGAAQKTITLAALNKIQIAVPPMAEQARIVTILDKFDALTTSLTEGLPREIELRQKQFEYYRNLLLSFKPEAVEV